MSELAFMAALVALLVLNAVALAQFLDFLSAIARVDKYIRSDLVGLPNPFSDFQ
jgi:hypothetical protein